MFCILARLLFACPAEDPPLVDPLFAPPEDPVPFWPLCPLVSVPVLPLPLLPAMSKEVPVVWWWCAWCRCIGCGLGCQGDIRWWLGGTADELETTVGGEKHVEEELRWSGKVMNDNNSDPLVLSGGGVRPSYPGIGFAVNDDYAAEMGKLFIV